MTRMTGLNQYQQEVLRTAPSDPRAYPAELRLAAALMENNGHEHAAKSLLKMWNQLIWGLGLAGEAGEVADALKKKFGHGKVLENEHFKKELGDVQWYGNALADSFGYTAEDIATGNSEKLRARHPTGFTIESAEAKADEKPAPGQRKGDGPFGAVTPALPDGVPTERP